EAIAAGMPEDRMPEVKIRRGEYTPAAINTDSLTGQATALFAERFGADRVRRVPPPMVGEDFGRYHITDTGIESLIFWVGGVPQDKWDAAGGDPSKLPSLHSPFWAPEAETVIRTGAEALSAAAMALMPKS
ncbi:MAG: amidohydrolase, partial [Allosphingosinicella sp.]